MILIYLIENLHVFQIILKKENLIEKQCSAALNFAWSNRQMLTHWTRNSFQRVFNQSESDLDMKLVYDVAHNIAKVEKHKVDGTERNLVVHRKGATRAFPANRNEIPFKYRDLGQPVLVPGSMGTASWILLGQAKFNEFEFWFYCSWCRKNNVPFKG